MVKQVKGNKSLKTNSSMEPCQSTGQGHSIPLVLVHRIWRISIPNRNTVYSSYGLQGMNLPAWVDLDRCTEEHTNGQNSDSYTTPCQSRHVSKKLFWPITVKSKKLTLCVLYVLLILGRSESWFEALWVENVEGNDDAWYEGLIVLACSGTFGKKPVWLVLYVVCWLSTRRFLLWNRMIHMTVKKYYFYEV